MSEKHEAGKPGNQPAAAGPARRPWEMLPVLLLGCASGILGSAVLFGLVKLDYSSEARFHPLLSTHFLTFLAILILALLFYQPIRALLGKGSLTIKWGDREISLTEIETSVNQNIRDEKTELETEVEGIVDQIKDMRTEFDTLAGELDALRQRPAGGAGAPEGEGADPLSVKVERARDAQHRPRGLIDDIKQHYGVDHDDAAAVIYHLGNSKFQWRNANTLSARTGLSEERLENLARSMPQTVVRGHAKSGRPIYRLTDEHKARFKVLADKP